MKDIIDGLAALVGRDNVAADPASLEKYAQDESFVPRLTPWAVVRPGSADEVQQVVAWANETATPLVPVSSGGPRPTTARTSAAASIFASLDWTHRFPGARATTVSGKPPPGRGGPGMG